MCIYTNTFLQIAYPLGLNLRFLFEFGEVQRYETLLGYQESSNRSRPSLEPKSLTWHILEIRDSVTVHFYLVPFLYVT